MVQSPFGQLLYQPYESIVNYKLAFVNTFLKLFSNFLKISFSVVKLTVYKIDHRMTAA